MDPITHASLGAVAAALISREREAVRIAAATGAVAALAPDLDVLIRSGEDPLLSLEFHRHFSHRSFQAATPVRHLLAALGSMAFQGTVLWWVGVHRTHHRYSDRPDDPHSPLKGFWRAHMGWILNDVNPLRWTRRVKDLLRDPVAVAAHRRYYVWVALGMILPGIAVGLATQSWLGIATGILWGGLVRLFLVNHIVWSVNSICPCYGSQPYQTHDDARNNYWLLLPSMGFSLHNNHHAFPYAAINSHAWWQIDLCGMLVRGLELLGLAWDVREAPEKRKAIAQNRLGELSP